MQAGVRPEEDRTVIAPSGGRPGPAMFEGGARRGLKKQAETQPPVPSGSDLDAWARRDLRSASDLQLAYIKSATASRRTSIFPPKACRQYYAEASPDGATPNAASCSHGTCPRRAAFHIKALATYGLKAAVHSAGYDPR